MTNQLMKPVVFLFATTLFLGAAWAQAPANFSGEWTLNASKSDYGPVPAPEFMTRTVKQSDTAVEISTHQKGAQGESTTQLKYTTDGKECVNKLPTGESKGTAKWKGSNLVIDSVRDLQGTPIKSTETWELSGGGKVFTIVNHLSVPQGEFDLKLVFEKK